MWVSQAVTRWFIAEIDVQAPGRHRTEAATWSEAVRSRFLAPVVEALFPGSEGWPRLIGIKDHHVRWGDGGASVQLSGIRNGLAVSGISDDLRGWARLMEVLEADRLDELRFEITPLLDGFPSFEPCVIFGVRLRARGSVESVERYWCAVQPWITRPPLNISPASALLELFADAASRFDADSGHLSVSEDPVRTQHERNLGLSGHELGGITDYARGAGWVTVLGNALVDGLGGVDGIARDAPVEQVIDLSRPGRQLILLIAASEPDLVTPTMAVALHRYLEPVLQAPVDAMGIHSSDWIEFSPVGPPTGFAPVSSWPDSNDPLRVAAAIPIAFVGTVETDPLSVRLITPSRLSDSQLAHLAGFLDAEVERGADTDVALSFVSELERLGGRSPEHVVTWWVDAANAPPDVLSMHLKRLAAFVAEEVTGARLEIGAAEPDRGHHAILGP